MAWFRSRREGEVGHGNIRILIPSATSAPPSRFKRWRRRLGRGLGALFLFGVVVSAIGFCRAPEVRLTAAPDSSVQINEVTRLYPVTMGRVVTPHTVEEIAEAVKSAPGPISIGGGRFSMGGQTATPDGLQLDMREYHGVVALDTAARIVTVRSGTRWRELQQAIDPAGLAVKIMQTYNTFTVGGALSVNAHGRYIGQGPLIRSVRGITMVLADGRIVRASRDSNPELFFGAVGGYGALGVIADVTLDLATNSRVQRVDRSMPVDSYLDYFRRTIQPDTGVIFHNADIYPPNYEKVHAVSYVETTLPVTVADHIRPPEQDTWLKRATYATITSGSTGHWLREHVIDPLIFRGQPVTWRNYEASYDVSELEPDSREKETYVLQEYFVPADSLPVFVPRMREVLQQHHVNAVNVSIRHALPDPDTYLAWAPTEVFAYVLYYKQGTDPDSRREVGRWTRQLIEAAVRSGGRYYLPYQPVATRDQFHRAYARSGELFALKQKVDPTDKFTNTLWDIYRPDSTGEVPAVSAAHMPAYLPAEVSMVLDTLPGYARPEGSEYLTHPEWDLVYSSEAYARWISAGKRPSEFPFVGSVGTFWRSYLDVWQVSRNRYPAGIGRHVMLWVIGLSTAIEYGLKASYEKTIGWVFEHAMPEHGTAEDQYSARVADDYAKLIAQKGWYEFGFWHALVHLWTDVPMTGPGFFRKWERREALTIEYGVKAIYAELIGLATGTAYAPDELLRHIVVAGWSDSLAQQAPPADSALKQLATETWLDRRYALLSVPRYNPYRDALLAMARHASDLRIAEISGDRVVTVTGTAPQGWQFPNRTSVVAAYTAPSQPERIRVVLAVDARELLEVLASVDGTGLSVDHIYDY